MKFCVTEENFNILGRTLALDGVRYLSFSGCSVSFSFHGKKASAKFVSNPEMWEENLHAQLAVYINDEDLPSKRIELTEKEQIAVLYESETESDVTIKIMKYSENAFAVSGIEYVETDSAELLSAPCAKDRKIEIIGDSITCGYGVEAEGELIPFSTNTQNPTLSYSLLTAKALNADATLVSWSGNGLISHYVDESATEPRSEWLMPFVYKYTDITASTALYGKENTDRWELNKPQKADLVIINLGTNDCSWCKDIEERKAQFRKTYVGFLKQVREAHPEAKILSLLGTMDQRLVKDIDMAVEAYKNETNDANIEYLPLPEQNAKDGYGSDWHPSPYTHREASKLVVAKAKEMMGW